MCMTYATCVMQLEPFDYEKYLEGRYSRSYMIARGILYGADEVVQDIYSKEWKLVYKQPSGMPWLSWGHDRDHCRDAQLGHVYPLGAGGSTKVRPLANSDGVPVAPDRDLQDSLSQHSREDAKRERRRRAAAKRDEAAAKHHKAAARREEAQAALLRAITRRVESGDLDKDVLDVLAAINAAPQQPRSEHTGALATDGLDDAPSVLNDDAPAIKFDW